MRKPKRRKPLNDQSRSPTAFNVIDLNRRNRAEPEGPGWSPGSYLASSAAAKEARALRKGIVAPARSMAAGSGKCRPQNQTHHGCLRGRAGRLLAGAVAQGPRHRSHVIHAASVAVPRPRPTASTPSSRSEPAGATRQLNSTHKHGNMNRDQSRAKKHRDLKRYRQRAGRELLTSAR